ncbi:hypothetical protein ACHAWF_008624 [Thalassiosira exigua]
MNRQPQRCLRRSRKRKSTDPIPDDDTQNGPFGKPRAEHTPESEAPVLEEPLEFVGRIRDEMRQRVESMGKKETQSFDVAQNVREIRAILAVNAEIYQRCSRSMMHKKGVARVRRYRCEKVIARSVDSVTQFLAESEISEREFDVELLATTPDCLEENFACQPRFKVHRGFIDFDAYFQSSLALHEDVLGPFLAHLKDHLEKIQVCLGEIEQWLLEPHDNTTFVESMFGTKLSPLDEDGDDEAHYLGNGDILAEEWDEESTFVRDESNKLKRVCPLTKFDAPGTGRYLRKFDVSIEGDRVKLKRFLEFIAG